jgi:type I restriction enzyme, S subunit
MPIWGYSTKGERHCDAGPQADNRRWLSCPVGPDLADLHPKRYDTVAPFRVPLSFTRSAWECGLGRSNGPNPYATLERQDLLPRWSVGARNLHQLLVRRPPLNEQLAIAAALSDVDALLAKLDALIAKKRDLKLAAMQQLLTGQTRLPGFGNAWETRELGEGISLLSGHHVLAQHCNSQGDGVPYLTGPADFQDGIIRHTKFTDRPTTLCEEFDILVTVKGSGSGTLVMADGIYCISRQLMAIPVNNWDRLFIFFSLIQNSTAIKAASTSLIPGLSCADILEQAVLLSPSHQEQTAIATILSTMDAEIAALEARRDKTRDIKQGMMQELLTGRIRLV